MRDFVAGVLWGGVVATVGLGVISQVSTLPPAGKAVESPVSEAAPGTTGAEAPTAEPEAVPAKTASSAAAPEETPSAVAEPAPEGQAPAIGTETGPEDVAAAEPTAPGEAPLPEAAPALPDTASPETAPETALALNDPAPAAPGTVGQAPSLPQSADAPAGAEGEAAPAAVASPAPSAVSETDPGALTANSAAIGDSPAKPAAEGEIAATPGAGPAAAADSAEPLPEAAEPPPLPEPAAPDPDDALLEPAAPEAEPPLPALIAPDPSPEAAQPSEAAPVPELPVQEPEPPALEAEVQKPVLIVPDGTDRLIPAPGLRMGETGRLPTIGAEGKDAAAKPEDQPPVTRYAAAFDNPGGKPAFAILLLDPGTAEVDRVKLAALPFPVTFVLDPQAANAAEAAATYRAAGKEVVMLASGIPKGATAGDLEQSFQSNSSALPESVAVMDLASGGFQDNRPLATLVVPVIKAEGRGLLTFDRGLNAADQVARREDVPAAVIFRSLDAEGEEAPVIRRYLDRAAFKAAQDGRVAVLGTARMETVAAILEWTVEGRASSVALAPVSAVLRVE